MSVLERLAYRPEDFMCTTSPSSRAGFRAATIVAVLTCSTGSLAARQVREDRLRVLDDTTIVQQVELLDGTKLFGRIARIDGTQILFATMGGLEIGFQRRDVNQVRVVRGQRHRGEFWPADPSDSRLFLAPTARVPGHGHGYAGVYELVVPSFGVGIGKIGMISGGFSAIPGIDLEDQVFYIAPKLQLFSSEYVQGAVGLFWVKPGTSEESVGMVYTGITAGDFRAAFSGGIAFPFGSRSGFSEDPLLMLGGEVRATKSLKFITENWIVPGEETTILSFGFRIIQSRLTVEAAVATSTEGGGFLPLVNFSITW